MYLLIFSLFNIWLAWNLYKPAYKPTALLFFSGFSAILLSELVIHFIVLEMLIVLVLLVCGWVDLSEVRTMVSLALLCIAWLAMSIHYYRGAEIGELLEGALQKDLGKDYLATISQTNVAKISDSLSVAKLLRPFSFRSPDVVREKDISFYETDTYNLLLDVYHHQDKPQHAPVLLNIHGGGWMTGNKTQQSLPLLHSLAAKGWVCVSINYRLSPKYAFPAHLIDCKRGLAWIKEHIADYGGNPDFVIASGGSTGGNLSSLMALTQNQAALQPGFEDVDTTVNGCVSMYGVYDFANQLKLSHIDLVNQGGAKIMHTTIEDNPELYQLASPVVQIHEKAPPFLVIHGAVDNFTSCPEAERFSEMLRDVSKQPVVFAKLPLTHHGFDTFWSLRTSLSVAAIERFLTYVYSASLAEKKEDASE